MCNSACCLHVVHVQKLSRTNCGHQKSSYSWTLYLSCCQAPRSPVYVWMKHFLKRCCLKGCCEVSHCCREYLRRSVDIEQLKPSYRYNWRNTQFQCSQTFSLHGNFRLTSSSSNRLDGHLRADVSNMLQLNNKSSFIKTRKSVDKAYGGDKDRMRSASCGSSLNRLWKGRGCYTIVQTFYRLCKMLNAGWSDNWFNAGICPSDIPPFYSCMEDFSDIATHPYPTSERPTIDKSWSSIRRLSFEMQHYWGHKMLCTSLFELIYCRNTRNHS